MLALYHVSDGIDVWYIGLFVYYRNEPLSETMKKMAVSGLGEEGNEVQMSSLLTCQF